MKRVQVRIIARPHWVDGFALVLPMFVWTSVLVWSAWTGFWI